MVALIGKLYRIERAIKDKTPDEREMIRREKAKPILDKIKTCLDCIAGNDSQGDRKKAGGKLHALVSLGKELTASGVLVKPSHIRRWTRSAGS